MLAGMPRPPKGTPTPFGALLVRAIERSGETLTAFAAKVGVTPTLVSFIVYGKRTPTPDAMARWADVLGLAGGERQAFMAAAALEHVPDPLREYVQAKRR